MNLEELKAMTTSEIEHHGKKGMKWGVRKSDTGKGASVTKAKAPKEPGKTRKAINSSKREAMLLKELKDPSKFTDGELRTKTKRIQDENSLKRLTETKGIKTHTKKALEKRSEYWDRDKLSDSQLKTRIDRLQLEANLKNQVKSANATNIKVANTLINQVSQVALSKYSDGKGGFSATGDPMYDAMIKGALEQTSKKKIVKIN